MPEIRIVGGDAPGRNLRLTVTGESDIAEAMRQVRRLGQDMGLTPVEVSYLATVATELASNLLIHAGGGQLQATAAGDVIELVAIDHGPGIADVELALCDGYSTGGGLGCGLPGVKRLMDGLEIDTRPGEGTRVRTWKRRSGGRVGAD